MLTVVKSLRFILPGHSKEDRKVGFSRTLRNIVIE